jgi:hypothetical protein
MAAELLLIFQPQKLAADSSQGSSFSSSSCLYGIHKLLTEAKQLYQQLHKFDGEG